MELGILLLIFGSDRQFRRVKAVKNTLRGRRTVSNLYWALQYGMLDFVDALHGEQFGDDQKTLTALKSQGLVDADDAFQIQLTPKGITQQQQYLNQLMPLKYLAIASKYDVAKFMQRFSFAVQIVSEYSYGNSKYYPQRIDYFEDQLLKRWFVQNKENDLPNHFHKELNDFLGDLGDDHLADTFTESLIGHHFSGLTADQIASQHQVPATIIEFQWLQLYGKLLTNLLSLPKNNVFSMLTADLEKPIVSNSARETFDMFLRQGDGNLGLISKRRKIKLTTVYEHLLEAAIMAPVKGFPYQALISSDLMGQLRAHQPENVGDWNFQDASHAIPNLEFFQFRLFQIYRSKSTDED